jgi:hypothetical protein
VAQAAGLLGLDERGGVRVRGVVPGSGTVLVAVSGRDDAEGPEHWRVNTAREGDLIVAWTTGEREGS